MVLLALRSRAMTARKLTLERPPEARARQRFQVRSQRHTPRTQDRSPCGGPGRSSFLQGRLRGTGSGRGE